MAGVIGGRVKMTFDDAVHRAQMLREYSVIVDAFEEASSRTGEQFGVWLTPEQGRLTLAALRSQVKAIEAAGAQHE